MAFARRRRNPRFLAFCGGTTPVRGYPPAAMSTSTMASPQKACTRSRSRHRARMRWTGLRATRRRTGLPSATAPSCLSLRRSPCWASARWPCFGGRDVPECYASGGVNAPWPRLRDASTPHHEVLVARGDRALARISSAPDMGHRSGKIQASPNESAQTRSTGECQRSLLRGLTGCLWTL